MINRSDIYQNAALSKESRCDAFINCVISICFYIISASLALGVRGGVFADFVLLSFFPVSEGLNEVFYFVDDSEN